mmetsp:Transcript_73444/g.215400  ORF Transcript_73444/g.215400 Transcript_73444/m.215400 type:complete len:585 (-) Transcript_73444:308-2062(-)
MADNVGDVKDLLTKGKSGDALLVASKELARAKESGEHKLQADASVMIAEIYMRRQQPEMALRALKDALLSCKTGGDKKTEASVLQTVANAFLMVSASEQALRAATQLEAVTDSLGDKEGKADARLLAAQALLSRDDVAGSLVKATEAVDLHKTAGGKRSVAVALQTLAEIQLRRQDGDAALSVSRDAATIFEELGDRPGQAAALNAVAGALQLRGETEDALKSAREALLLFRQAGDRKGETVAKATCACLRPKPEARAPFQAPAKVSHHSVPGYSAPGIEASEPAVEVTRIIGSAEAKHLVGTVVVVTGASRGIGKGIATLLAEAGAIVYVSGRSSPGKSTEPALQGTVDETAAVLPKLGGVGVATHVDHAQKSQSKALAELIANNHGRLDLLVNNAYFLPAPDENFYGRELWSQPTRYLNEQSAVGSLNHVAQTLYMLPCLRRGKGLAVNISNAASQNNVATLPVSFFCSKASFDRAMSALSERVRHSGVYVLTLWPGLVRTERTKAAAQRAKATRVVDAELARFSGLAVRQLAGMERTELARLASTRRTLATTDVAKFDVDGYAHEGNLRTFTTGGRIPLMD